MRLIDADALFEFAKTEEGAEILDHSVFKVLLLRRILDKAPTIEAEPVRHGEWIEHFSNGCWHYDCPFCDDGYATKERQEHPENYCSNCGAKLEGRKRE